MTLTLFLVLFVASAAILTAGLFVSSSFVGGIEFGQAHHALARGALLLLAVNVVAVLLPYGVWLTLPVWWLGLVYLFRVNFFAAWLPVGLSFVLYLIAFYLIRLAVGGVPTITVVPV